MGALCGLILGIIAGYAAGIALSERTIRDLKDIIKDNRKEDGR